MVSTAERVTLRVPAEADEGYLAAVLAICRAHRGLADLVLEVGARRVDLGPLGWIEPRPEALAALSELGEVATLPGSSELPSEDVA